MTDDTRIVFLIALSEHPRLFLLEHLLRYECGSHRRRPACIESEVGDDLAEFVLGETIIERPLQMADELLFAAEGDQGSADDQTAVALGEAGPLPNFAKQHPLAEIDQARDDVADLFASRRRLRSSHGCPPLFGPAVAIRGNRSTRPRERAREESAV